MVLIVCHSPSAFACAFWLRLSDPNAVLPIGPGPVILQHDLHGHRIFAEEIGIVRCTLTAEVTIRSTSAGPLLRLLCFLVLLAALPLLAAELLDLSAFRIISTSLAVLIS